MPLELTKGDVVGSLMGASIRVYMDISRGTVGGLWEPPGIIGCFHGDAV